MRYWICQNRKREIDLISENVSLPELIEDVMDVFRPLAAEKHLELQINADHVRHEKVVTDQNRLQQVLVNLLSNAIKYTLREAVWVSGP